MNTTKIGSNLILGFLGLSLAACAGASGGDPSPDDTSQATAAETLDDSHDGKKDLRRGPPDPAEFVKRFDANGDGKLELAELPGRMGKWLGKADSNGDGALTVDELVAHHEAKKGRHFARMDKNGDGAVSADEVDERHWAHLSAADADKSGTVTRAELDQAMANGTLKPPHGHHRRGIPHHGEGGHEGPHGAEGEAPTDPS